MMAVIEIKRGDVVRVNLRGAEGNEKQDTRLCVVVQNDVGNQYSPLTIVAPITDARQDKKLPVQVVVTPAECAALSKPSVIECGHLRTIDRDTRIEAHLGSMPAGVMTAVDKALSISVGLK
jgi:mRNA interferase MazF